MTEDWFICDDDDAPDVEEEKDINVVLTTDAPSRLSLGLLGLAATCLSLV